MHLRDHEQLGDEPLYYEADHGSVYYSGSEDDYYEAPEHRRLRIEAQAVQFLNGQVPYLLSARLEGPFDKESWTNPWRSKRAERQINPSRSSAKRSVKTVEGARADVTTDKATDDLPDTQRTNLYPLPSPETTNPPSDRKNPYLDDREYDRIKEWRDIVEVEEVSTPADPFRASRHDARSNTSSTKKRPANHEWLRKDEPKKRRSTKPMTFPPIESPSRAAAQARSQRISRQSSVLTQCRIRSAARSEDAVSLRDAPISSFVASGVAKGFETTPGLPRMTDESLSGKQIFYEKSDSSEDELSKPSTTSSGRAARSSVGKLSSPDCSPSRRSKQTQRSKKLASQAVGQAANNGVLQAETEEGMPRSTLKSMIMKITRSGWIGHSQQDSSFCFHQLKAKSPVRDTSHPHAKENDPNEFAAGFSSPQHVDAAAIAERADHPCYQDQPAQEQDDNDEADPDRMEVDTHDPIPHSRESCSNSSVLEQSNDRQRTEPESVDQIRSRANSVLMNNQCETIRPDALPKRTEGTHQVPTKKDIDTSSADWTTYINTLDLSVVFNGPLQANQSHGEIPFLGQGPEDEGDSDWATVVSNEELLMPDSTSIETAKVKQHLPVVEQGPDDTSESEWSTFLNTLDRFTATPKQSGSSVLRRNTMDDIPEYDSDSDWSTCMSVSSQIEADQTGNTSHGPLPADLVDSEGKSPQGSLSSIVVPPAQDTEASLSPRETSPARTPHDTVVTVLCTGENTRLEEMMASDGKECAASPPAESPTSELEQESVGCLGADQDEDLAKSDTGPFLGADMTPGTSRTGHRVSTQGEMIVDLKTPETTMDARDTADSIVVNAGLDAKTMADESPADSRNPADADMVVDLKIPERMKDVQHTADSRAVNTAMTSTKRWQCQSPWSKSSALDAHPGEGPVDISCIANERRAESEAPQEQSPWFKEHVQLPMKNGQSTHCDGKADNDGGSSDLSLLAGQALVFISTPQTPWMGDKLPSPNFSLSVKRFSDFMKPSPTKKRSSPNQSILLSPTFGSEILFKSSELSRPQRRVKFAPLPGEEATDSVDSGSQESSSMYVEEDVSYFGLEGRKTTTVRVTRPPIRAASPPPRDVNSAEAGKIPDHDHKFAKHFEAMSKRKKNSVQRTPRLLPSDSPQTNSSQELGAMAEAFIQASQTRRKGLELDASSIGSPVRALSESHTPDEQATPLRTVGFEDQENAAPVDDVSAVLDNLNDFLDNTWGINLSMDEGQDAEPGFQHKVSTPPIQNLKSPSKQDGDPMWGLDFNVWAD